MDTALKRGSAVNPLMPWRAMLPFPDGVVGQGDRQATAFVYSGILAGAAVVVVAEPDTARGHHGAPLLRAKKLYLPPGQWSRKKKKRAVAALQAVYEEARAVIPGPLQVGLLPTPYRRSGRLTQTLPPPSGVDFQALAGSLQTIQVILAALESAIESKRMAEEGRLSHVKQRRREEEALVMLLLEI